MRKILVTAVSGDIANGILKILQEQDAELYGCDVNSIAAGMDRVKKFWQSRYAVEEGYTEELLGKCLEYGITHLIPVNEREIEVVSDNRKLFEEHGIKIVIQDERILDICLDKYKTAQLLTDNGFDVPGTYVNPCLIEVDGSSYICKPRKSNGSKGIQIYSAGEIADIKKRYYADETAFNNINDNIQGEDCVYQRYIDSDEEYTIGVFRDIAVINTIAFRRELKNGYSNIVKLSNAGEYAELAIRIAKLLNLKGYINIQLRKKDDRLYIFEINPRISGTVRFRHMLGFTDVLWWLDMLDNIAVPEFRCEYNEAVGIRELNEKYVILKT